MNTIKFPFLVFLLLLFSCAEVVPPSGGDLDTQAPKIKKSIPENNTIFFDNNRIEITFDEFIKFSNSSENVFISPALKEKPVFKHIGKKLIISFQEELALNTTYTITINESIEDINEGNTLDLLKYTFSTGSYIDSLSIKGTVLDAFNKKPIDKVYVFLYSENEDSVLYKKPLYIAKTNKEGNYVINNLKAAKYQIAVLEDKNLNLIYDQKEERIAFSDKSIAITENTSLAPFFIFKNEKDIYITEHKQAADNHYTFKFNKAIETSQIDISDYSETNIIHISEDKQNIDYWYTAADSISTFIFKINDSFADTITKTLSIDTSSSFTIISSAYQTENQNIIEIQFPKPITSFNEDSFILTKKENTNLKYQYNWENNKTKLIIKTNSIEDSIILIIKEACFISFDNKTNQNLTDSFLIFENNKANLILNLPSNSSNLILQLLDSKENIIQQINVSRETLIKFNEINSGKYFVRIFNDNNDNGLWDSGLFHVKQFPEETIFYSKEITLSPTFDQELDIKY